MGNALNPALVFKIERRWSMNAGVFLKISGAPNAVAGRATQAPKLHTDLVNRGEARESSNSK